jgi:hypothetical protein
LNQSLELKYGCEIILKSPYCNKSFYQFIFQTSFRKNVKLKSLLILMVKIILFLSYTGGFDMDAFGPIAVVGDSLDVCMKPSF